MFTAAFAFHLLLPGSLQRLPVDPLVRNGVTQFHILQKNFDRGIAVSLNELPTSLKGRCYFLDSPTTPVASVLAVSNDGTQQGPGFAGDDYKRVTPLISPETPLNKFERLDIDGGKELDEAIKRFGNANAYPVFSNGSLVIEGLRTVDFQRRDYALRKLKNFYLLRMTCEEDSYCLSARSGTLTNRVIANSGESPVVCYYWRKPLRH